MSYLVAKKSTKQHYKNYFCHVWVELIVFLKCLYFLALDFFGSIELYTSLCESFSGALLSLSDAASTAY